MSRKEISNHSKIKNGFPNDFRSSTGMYAISIDLDSVLLKVNYGDTHKNATLEIRQILNSHGFSRQQASVYFGGETVTAISCVLAAQDLARSLTWFAHSVSDIRMFRIEELNDLMKLVQHESATS